MKYLLRNTMLQVAAFLCLLTIAGPFLHGQANAGAISGTVTDSTGAAIVGAKVTITNQSTAVPYEKTTDSSGFYSVEGLTNGLYTVDVAKSGFQESVTSGIQLDPGQRRASNVVLAVGSATAQVTVEANALEVNTESSESAGTVSSSQIENLMLNGRNFETLALSIPGVSDVHGADSLGGGGLEGGTSLIVNGNSVEYSTYTIDGVYNMNSGNMAGIDITPIPDGISEFSVEKDSYNAKFDQEWRGDVPWKRVGIPAQQRLRRLQLLLDQRPWAPSKHLWIHPGWPGHHSQTLQHESRQKDVLFRIQPMARHHFFVRDQRRGTYASAAQW